MGTGVHPRVMSGVVCALLLQFEPTCAVLDDGSRKQYSSPCNACADDRVVRALIGPCPE